MTGLLDFETTPAGVAPADDELLDAPYSIEGGSVRFFFDANGNSAYDSGVDLNPVFERIGGDGVNGFRSTYFNGAFDRARPGYEAQLGNFFLRHPGPFGTTDVGKKPFIIDYDVTIPITELSGEIWDIDSAPAGTEQWRIEVLDSLGGVLATKTSPLGIIQSDPSSLDSLPWTFQFTNLPAGVDKLRFTFVGTKTTGLGFALNNFSPTLAVPEPSAARLAGVAFALIAGVRLLRWRQRRASYSVACAAKQAYRQLHLCAGATRAIVALAAALTLLCPATVAAAEYLGPSPYLAFDHPDAGSAVSPFKDLSFDYFHLEDFEDGAFNAPGVTVREFATPTAQIAFSDSVDGDDGVIDGFATGNSRSLHSNFTANSFTFDFSKAVLGALPTHAGIVWTDVGFNFGGNPLPSYLVDNTIFEAFGPGGESLGIIGPFSLGDSSISRTTGEDRFFGVIHEAGISAIRISMPGKNKWEVDHLQFGGRSVPKPGALALASIGGGLLNFAVRRRARRTAPANR